MKHPTVLKLLVLISDGKAKEQELSWSSSKCVCTTCPGQRIFLLKCVKQLEKYGRQLFLNVLARSNKKAQQTKKI